MSQQPDGFPWLHARERANDDNNLALCGILLPVVQSGWATRDSIMAMCCEVSKWSMCSALQVPAQMRGGSELTIHLRVVRRVWLGTLQTPEDSSIGLPYVAVLVWMAGTDWSVGEISTV